MKKLIVGVVLFFAVGCGNNPVSSSAQVSRQFVPVVLMDSAHAPTLTAYGSGDSGTIKFYLKCNIPYRTDSSVVDIYTWVMLSGNYYFENDPYRSIYELGERIGWNYERGVYVIQDTAVCEIKTYHALASLARSIKLNVVVYNWEYPGGSVEPVAVKKSDTTHLTINY